jgi:hypothetical protein
MKHLARWPVSLALAGLAAAQELPHGELVERASRALGAQGTTAATPRVRVRSRAECEEAQLADLRESFGAARADAYRLLLQTQGLRFASGEELLAEWARRRTAERAALYLPADGEIALVAEREAELSEREHEIAAALAMHAHREAGHAGLEPAAHEPLDRLLLRQALLGGGAIAEADRALAPEGSRAEGVPRGERWARAAGLPPLEEEAWVRGFESFARVSDAEAFGAAWQADYPSTEQLLHPDKRGQDVPVPLALPEWPAHAGGARLLHEDTLGELAIAALLIELGSEPLAAEVAATGWDGDRLRHYRLADGQDVIVWRTLWDRSLDAEQFAEEWMARCERPVVRRGRSVAWVMAEAKPVANKLMKALDALPPLGPADEADAKSTKRAEEQSVENRRSAPYIAANEWRHPALDLTVIVPIGWYEEERDGVAYIVRTKTAGYRDNIQVLAGTPPDAETIDRVLAINEKRLASDGNHALLSAEKRKLGDLEVGLLRYRSRQGGHDVIFSTLVILRDRRQIAVTVGVEAERWSELEPIVEEILTNVRVGPVPPLR